jgi:lysophospholipase L1-like esterase
MRRFQLYAVCGALLGMLLLTLWLAGRLSFAPATSPSWPLQTAYEYGLARVLVMNAQIREGRPGYVFLAGDSHAELFGARLPCDRDLINGGVSGAKIDVYRRVADRLEFVVPPGVIFLVIGTNDLFRKHHPLKPESLLEFEDDAEVLVRRLASSTSRLIVTAIPPIGEGGGALFETGAVQLYSERLAAVCGRLGCEYVDAFAGLRSAKFGVAKPGMTLSHVPTHLQSYVDAYKGIAPRLCS